MKKIEVTGISSKYEDLRVLEDISLFADERELVSILGPSGCGKSTLFNIISGLIKPDAGKVLINGEDHTGKPGRVSYMHQKDLLFPWRTIMDNVIIPLVIRGEGIEKARAQADKYFPVFGLEGFQDRYPFQLSGGMRQRAALLGLHVQSDISAWTTLRRLGRHNQGRCRNAAPGFRKAWQHLLFIPRHDERYTFRQDIPFHERSASVRVFTVDIDGPGEQTFTSDRFTALGTY